MWKRHVRWARLRRVTFKAFFLPELLIGAFFPLACAFGLAVLGVVPPVTPVVLAILWYGGEALVSRSAGWHLSTATPLAWFVRDVLLPMLWISAWLGNRFVWWGNAMSVEAERRPGLIERLLPSRETGESPDILSGALARWKTRHARDQD